MAVPTLTSTVPVATGDAGLPNAAPVELPAFAPPVRQVELVVPADSVIGVRLDEPLSSAKAVVEDRVTAVVTRDVIVDGRTAIPAGSRVAVDVRVSGWVLWKHPEVRPLRDLRAEIYSAAAADAYAAFAAARPGWADYAATHHVNAVLAAAGDPLDTALAQSPGWSTLARSDDWALWAAEAPQSP